MRLFIKKYILIFIEVIVLYSILLLGILPYTNSFTNYFNKSLILIVIYFLSLRFLDDYEDYYKDKINNKTLFSRKSLLICFMIANTINLTLIIIFKYWTFIFAEAILFILMIWNNKYIKLLILPSIALSIIYCDFYLHWSNVFIIFLFFLIELAFSFAKKDPQLELKNVGGKAFNLDYLSIRSTPKFIAIPVDVISTFDEEIINCYIKSFCKKNKKYAVRSSAIDEDSNDFSFAGVHDSYLNVNYNDLLTKIRLVKESSTNERAINYRKQNGLSIDDIKISVMIQEMVQADFAGVINTINPITNDINEIVISVCSGLGDKLVDGSEDGTIYYVNGSKITSKGNDFITKRQLKGIIKLANKVSAKTDRFQDIEFAGKKNKIYFLQSRAITIYKDINPHKMTLLIDNSNIIESYYGITSYLTFSFANEVYKKVYTETLKVAKVRKKILKALDNSLANMLYYYEGKVYYNLKSWYHVSSIFPSKNAIGYMENMMGVKSSNNDYKRVKLNIFDIIKIGFIFLRKLKNMDKLSYSFIKNFNQIILPYYGKEMNYTNEELKKIYESIEKKIIPEFTTPIINDCAVMFYFGKLKSKASKYSNKDEIVNECIFNNGDVESALSVLAFSNIIDSIKSDEAILNDFICLSEMDLYNKYYHSNTTLSKLIKDYIYQYGSRIMNELKLETKTMIEEPIIIFKYLKDGLNASNTKINKGRSTIIPKELVALSNKAKKYIQNRERLRLRRTYIFSVVRNIFLNYGRNYCKMNRIDHIEDIFYLTKEEILLDMDDVRGLIEQRKKELASYKDLPYYDRIAFYDNIKLPILANSFDNKLVGIPSGAGEIKAHVSLMENITDELINGNIILTKRTDPGWISIFPLSSGLIVEHGSMLSHSFVVAREMGLPAVVGVKGATSSIKNGDYVHLDGIKAYR